MKARIIQFVAGRRYYYAGCGSFVVNKDEALLVPFSEVSKLVKRLSENNPHPLVVEAVECAS